MTDVDTLQSQLFPTPLVSKSLYGVMDFENELICFCAAERGGLVFFKKLNPRLAYQTRVSASD